LWVLDAKFARVFLSLFDYYSGMATKTKPIVVIVLAVALAGGIAVYLSRQTAASSSTTSDTTNSTNLAASSGGGHIRGKASAPVTLVEFGDYQCPSCGYYYPMVEELLRRYPDKVKLEFHHYPLIQVHAHALTAAMAAEAAGDQGKYWEMHDKLYQHQKEWSSLPDPEAQFLAYAGESSITPVESLQSVACKAWSYHL
jgi:protein-disulfide isomerase